jgi:hypothetical protein
MPALDTTSEKAVLISFLSDSTKQSLIPVLRKLVPSLVIRSFKSLNQTVDACIDQKSSPETLFIEFGHPLDELSMYLQMIRTQSSHKPEKIILLVDQEDVSEDLISKYLRIGFSGILTKPFNEKSVEDVFRLSEHLSNQGSFARLKVAAGLQIKSMFEQEGDKFQGSSILTAVKNACKKFEDENPESNLEQLARTYASMQPNERLGKNVKDLYLGASERVKKMLLERKKKEG